MTVYYSQRTVYNVEQQFSQNFPKNAKSFIDHGLCIRIILLKPQKVSKYYNLKQNAVTKSKRLEEAASKSQLRTNGFGFKIMKSCKFILAL